MRSRILHVLSVAVVLMSVRVIRAQSVDLANDYYQHGLNDKAKDILIGLIHGGAPPSTKARALYLLGEISFGEGRVKVALSDWEALVKSYPESPEGKEIESRLAQLSEIVSKASESSLSSAVASSYIANGDFWSKSESKFTIDSSWLPNVELADEWYDRVITEFPGTDSAEVAYERKLHNLLGWKEIGSQGEAYGLQANFGLYMPQVLSTFAAFEHDFPKSASLQAFRYQIAQAWWDKRNWDAAKEWLQKIIDQGNGQQTFYTELAKARMEKLQY